MPNSYPYCGDYMLEPPDDSIERDAFERKCLAAFDEYVSTGNLPDGRDSSHVDALTMDEIVEYLDAMMTANDDDLLDMAKALRDKRIEIVEMLIADGVER